EASRRYRLAGAAACRTRRLPGAPRLSRSRARHPHQLGARPRRPRALPERAPVVPRTRLPGTEARHVARDRRQAIALCELPLRVPRHPLEQRLATRQLEMLRACERALELTQHEGAVIGLAPEHHAVAPGQPLEHALRGAKPAVDDHRQTGEFALESAHDIVTKGRDLTVVLG